MGAILIAGLASLLISIFLGPKYIEYLRRREFGQQIREEGPAEHHLKAGTPTMGGLVVFTAIGIPYLILSDRDAASLAVFGTALASAAIGFITGGQDGLSITQQDGLSLLGACLVGASIGFLWFNSFPAAIFMGDTGSLGLGGAIAGMAVMTKSEVLLIVIGGIFVIEA